MRKEKQKRVKVIVYLSTDGDIYSTEGREDNQYRYISDYAKAHNLLIKIKARRGNEGQRGVNLHWKKMVDMIRAGKAEGILLANMAAVSVDVPDAYFKVGQVYAAGGAVYTVDEGKLEMPVRVLINGRMVLANEAH